MRNFLSQKIILIIIPLLSWADVHAQNNVTNGLEIVNINSIPNTFRIVEFQSGRTITQKRVNDKFVIKVLKKLKFDQIRVMDEEGDFVVAEKTKEKIDTSNLVDVYFVEKVYWNDQAQIQLCNGEKRFTIFLGKKPEP